jgi:hypothetical protein
MTGNRRRGISFDSILFLLSRSLREIDVFYEEAGGALIAIGFIAG